jgi:hypothetical protein
MDIQAAATVALYEFMPSFGLGPMTLGHACGALVGAGSTR